MIGALIGIIITLIVVGVLWWALQQLLPLIPLPEPFRKIIYVLMVVVLVLIVLWVILALIGVAGINVPGFHGRWGFLPGPVITAITANPTRATVYL